MDRLLLTMELPLVHCLQLWSLQCWMSKEWIGLLNFRFEGGCKYPYLSEVARSGFGWLSFLVGTGIGWIPWIIFAFDYYRVFTLFGMTVAEPKRKRRYLLSQKVSRVWFDGVCSSSWFSLSLLQLVCMESHFLTWGTIPWLMRWFVHVRLLIVVCSVVCLSAKPPIYV